MCACVYPTNHYLVSRAFIRSAHQGVATVEICFQICPDTYNIAKNDETNIGYFGGSHLPYFSQSTRINVRRNTVILSQR